MKKEFIYTIDINASSEHVYRTILDPSLYAEWAKPWGDGMTMKGEWKVGSHVIFGDSEGGTKALIEELVPGNVIKMKHVAMVGSDGKDAPLSDDAMKAWIDSREDYFFEEKDGVTTFKVVMFSDEMFKEMSEGAWPQALTLLKEICER
jgi:uncharacterized protein YndB with AHSA1/START domain